MPSVGEDITLVRGNSFVHRITVLDSDLNPVNVEIANEIIWKCTDLDENVVIEKGLADGVFGENVNEIVVPLSVIDTNLLVYGFYRYSCTVDIAGGVSTVTLGDVFVLQP